jgi:DNA uptake protein ComE-like DNA-binding protein
VVKQLLKDFLAYSKAERRGVIVLLGVLLLLIILNFSLHIWDVPTNLETNSFQAAVDSFEQQLQQAKRAKTSSDTTQSNPSSLQPFTFNPNKITEKQWKRLGLPDKVVATIQNYKQAGGSFQTKSDLKEIYGLSEEHYQQLKPYIRLPEQPAAQQSSAPDTVASDTPRYRSSPAYTQQKVPLNLSDSAQLEEVYGIGPYYASAIVKYRHVLGGYHDKKQLLEVWGLDSAAYERMRPHLILRDSTVRKLNIYRASVEDLGKHPYINWSLARGLHNFVQQHQPLRELPQLKEFHLLNDSIYQKVAPYLTLSNDSTES